MAKFNDGILHEIFLETIKGKNYFGKNGFALINFMLIGKETFKVVLDYFSQAKRAEIYRYSVTFEVIDSSGNSELYMFHLTFPLLKPILAAAGKHIEGLYIGYICMSSSSVYEHYNVFNHLIGENLQKIMFVRKIPHHYYARLGQLKNLESIQISCSDFDVSMIPASCRRLQINNVDWKASQFVVHKTTFFQKFTSHLRHFLHIKHNNIKLTFVEKLRIEGLLQHSDFTTANMDRLIAFVSTHFPKLQRLHVKYKVLGTWAQIKDTVLSFDPSMFKHLSPNVKGKIEFDTENGSSYEDSTVSTMNAGSEVLGKAHFIVNNESSTMQKTFEVHDGLFFNFWYSMDPLS